MKITANIVGRDSVTSISNPSVEASCLTTLGSDVAIAARLATAGGAGTHVVGEGNALVASDVSTITCSILDMSQSPPASTSGPSIVVGTAMLSSLSTDDAWYAFAEQVDAIGYNFTVTIPASYFASEVVYHVEFVFTLQSGGKAVWCVELVIQGCDQV